MMISQEDIMNMPEKELRAKLMYFAYRYYDYTIDDTSTLKVRKVYEGEDKQTLQGWGNYSIFVADLDNLKPLNDTKGHAAGDLAISIGGRAILESMAVNKGLIGIDEFGELIVREGENLEGIIDIVRHKAMAYRIGGDEMLVAKIHDTDCIKSI